MQHWSSAGRYRGAGLTISRRGGLGNTWDTGVRLAGIEGPPSIFYAMEGPALLFQASSKRRRGGQHREDPRLAGRYRGRRHEGGEAGEGGRGTTPKSNDPNKRRLENRTRELKKSKTQ